MNYGANSVSVVLDLAPCTITVNPTSASVAMGSGTGSVSVTASNSACWWTAVSNNPAWLSVTSPSSGKGSGSVNYSVASNSGPPRTGTLTIGGQTFTANQAGASGAASPRVGFFRAGMWLLDYNGNGLWDGPSTDRLYWLGQAGATALVGRW